MAAVRYATPGAVPAGLAPVAAVCFPSGARVDGGLAALPTELYLPSEAVPAGRRVYGAVQYLPGDPIPTGLRRVVLRSATGTAASTVVAADTPLGYWRLGETTGTTASDSSGNGHDGTYTAGYTMGQPGPHLANGAGLTGAGVKLDGSTGYVRVTTWTGLDFGTNPFSVECWLRFTANPASAAQLVCRGGIASAAGFNLQVATTGALLGKIADGTNPFTATSPATAYADGLWHHAAMVVDRANNLLRIYVDGVQVQTANIATAGSATAAATDLFLGARSDLNAAAFFAGTLAQVAVYGSALTPARITAHYLAGLGR